MLDTLANVKAALRVTGTDDDTTLNRLLTTAESFIAEHTGRSFDGGSFTETHPGGTTLVFLKNYPVTTLTDVRVDANRLFGTETVLDPTTYVVHADRGVVESVAGPFLPARGRRGSADWPGAVQVAYSTATGAVPGAVKEAFSQLVGHWYRLAKTNEDLAGVLLTEKTDETGTKTYSWSLASGLKVPAGVLQILAPFRVPFATSRQRSARPAVTLPEGRAAG
jgi:uncharacterized phiE125 gp8 family phage protein